MKIETQLIDALIEANLYYRKGKPIVSDAMYDAEYERLKKIYPDNEFFKKIGVEVTDKERERKLDIIMASLNKVKGMDELKDWFRLKNIPINTQLILTPKFDGLSLCVEETLNKATTRGDGVKGQASDEHYKLIKNKLFDTIEAPNFSPFIENIFQYTYGEIMMSKNTFNEKYEPLGFANPRNLVAGLINRPEPSEPLKDIEYIKYGAVLKDKYKNHYCIQYRHNILDLLNNGQKIKVPYKLVSFEELSEEVFVSLFAEWSINYEIDGIIIEINNLKLQNELGRERSTNNPVWARAYKSPAFEQSAITEVTGITWNISKQGYLKPIIHVEPIQLDGVIVSNVTGNNARYVKNSRLGIHSIVRIVRSGMVIPKIVDVLEGVDFVMPDIENIAWSESGIELITLTETKEQKFKQLVSFFEILEVSETGEGVLKQLWDAGYQSVKDILSLTPTDMKKLPGFAERKSEITYNSIQSKMKDVDLAKLQHGSGLFSGLGSKKLALLTHFNEKPTLEQILEIEGFAEKSALSYLDGYDNFKNFIKDLPITIKEIKEMKKNSNDLEGNVYTFTGIRDKDVEEEIIKRSGKIGSSVSSKTTHLVMKTTGSGSSKEQKAIELGINIITLDELWDELNS